MTNESRKRVSWKYTRPDGLTVEEKKIESINRNVNESVVVNYANAYF